MPFIVCLETHSWCAQNMRVFLLNDLVLIATRHSSETNPAIQWQSKAQWSILNSKICCMSAGMTCFPSRVRSLSPRNLFYRYLQHPSSEEHLLCDRTLHRTGINPHHTIQSAQEEHADGCARQNSEIGLILIHCWKRMYIMAVELFTLTWHVEVNGTKLCSCS